MESKFTVLVSDDISEKGIDLLRQDPTMAVDVKTKLSREELYAIIGDYDALITRSMTTVDQDLLDHTSGRLRVVGRAGVGLDNVDVEAASKMGIVVLNTPTGNTLAATEHTMAMLLAACRMIPKAHSTLVGGKWDRKSFMGFELYRRKLGIIGLGRIGSQVARRAKGFEMEIYAYDPYILREKAESLGVKLLPSLDELLETVDIITLHTPRTPETLGMIGTRELNLLPDGAIVVNVARGGLIVEEELHSALQSGKLRAAAVDVFDVEPAVDNKLLELDNIVVTPHLGANTDASQINVAVMVAQQVMNVLKGEDYEGAVNIPSVLTKLTDDFRIYFELAEKMGKILGSMIGEAIEECSLVYRGELFDREFGPRSFDVPLNLLPFSVAALKGIMEPKIQDGVSYISAPYIMRERGIRIEEKKVSASHDYHATVEIIVKTETQTRSIVGTVFENAMDRVVRLDEYEVDFDPQPPMLIFRNEDRNGLIGEVASLLGNAGINISHFALNRHPRGQTALGVVNTNQKVSADILERVESIDGILGAWAIGSRS
ncbi:phosphoglycerate dehydrogenase [Desulfurispira natronophila]|uniref:D-3-phosphoglycerate dehydrogenase n=1 Tax=Desulfurispira natronophila TaxID=682562 RepID=A0A7W7Y5G7_9BACT|nr:phosphoglycerate dehydrogenase [Desulfurispira natronophila]MBB5022433.1 D-3-phosphoglycerate dehydrogenase [Desulfurispira natronophila]